VIVLPAIDLLDARPVRLRQGDFDQVTRFGDDPVTLARGFEAGGAEWLHVVDLDGARRGRWRNLDVIAQIVGAVSVPVEAGGGARTTFEAWAGRYGDRIAVSLDARGDRLAVQGWAVESADRLSTVADALRAAGARRFIYTNVLRDGTLRGVDLAELQRLMPLGLPVIVAGGIASADDVRAVRDAGAEGVIIGRALVDGSLDLGDAMRAAAGQPVGPPAT